MTRKDYIKFAEAIKTMSKEPFYADSSDVQIFINDLIHELSRIFKADNTAFSPEKFRSYIEK